MANYFDVTGLAPTHDPRWATASTAQRATYLRALKVIVLTEWDRQTAAGLDKDGQRLAPLKPRTIRYRRSAMGPADPFAPPLIPAHALSRTRSLVDARPVGTAIRVFWKFDPISKKRWGTILNYHRRGAGHLPIRDVFGLSPEAYERAKRAAHLWWAGSVAGLPVVMPTRPRPGKSARPPAATLPAYQPKKPPPAPVPSKTANVAIGTDIYTMTKGAAAELLGAIKGGKFTGFRSYAGKGKAGPPPAPKAPPKPTPRPPTKPKVAAFDWSSVVDPQLGAYRTHAAEVAKPQERFWINTAMAAHTDERELKAKFDAGFRRVVDAADPYVRVKPHVLDAILSSGRIKNQFETKTSEGVLSAPVRQRVEASVMGVAPQTAAHLRPIYGYLGEPDFAAYGQSTEMMVNGYGTVSIRLKRSVLGRASVSIGDSLNNEEDLQATRADAPTALSLPVQFADRARHAAEALVLRADRPTENLRQLQADFSYVEVQYYGGVPIEDIAEVAFASQPTPDRVQALKERGIPWRVIQPGLPF